MNRIFTLFLIFILVFNLSFSYYRAWNAVDWEEKNPYIYPYSAEDGEVYYAWDVGHFNTILYNSGSSYIEFSYPPSGDRKRIASDIDEINKDITSTVDISLACKKTKEHLDYLLQEMNKTSEEANAFYKIRSFFDRIGPINVVPGVYFTYLSISMLEYIKRNELSELGGIYSDIVKDSEECIKYGDMWKKTMNKLSNVVDETYGDLIDKVYKARSCYVELSSKYGFPEFPDNSLREEFNSLSAAYFYLNCSSNKNTHAFCMLKSSISAFYSNISSVDPDISSFKSIISNYWFSGNVRGKLLNLSYKCNAIKEDADAYLEQMLTSTKGKLNSLRSCISGLENEGVYRFTRGIEVSNVIKGETVSMNISYRFSVLKSDYVYMYNTYTKAYTQVSYAPGNASRLLVNVSNSLEKDIEVCNELRGEMENVVSFLKDYVLKLSKSLSQQNERYVEESLAKVSKSTLGTRYETYINLINFIEDAKSYDTKQYNMTVLNNLISKAERDAIDVSWERWIASELKDNWNPDVYSSAISSILSKARIQYSDLPKRRSNLISNLTNAMAYDLLDEMRIREREYGVSFGSNFSYRNALGHLKDLEELYIYLSKQLTKEEVRKIKNAHVRYGLDVFFDTIPVIGMPGNASIYVHIFNPNEDPVYNFSIPFPSNIPKHGLRLLNISALTRVASADAIYTGATGNVELMDSGILFFKIPGNLSSTFRLYVSYLPIKVLKDSMYAVAYESNTADISREMKFYAYTDTYALPPSTYLNATACTLDGWKEITNNPVYVSKGAHTLKCEYTISPAYSITLNTTSVKETDISTKTCYALKLTPYEDYDVVNIYLDGITGKLSYDKTSHLSTIKPGAYGMYVKISDMHAGSSETIKFCTETSNLSSYVFSKILYYSSMELDKRATKYLTAARTLYDSGEYKRAFNEITQLSSYLSSEANEITNMLGFVNATLDRISEDYKRISMAISNASKNSTLRQHLMPLLKELQDINVSIASALNSGDVRGAYKWAKKYDQHSLQDAIYKYTNDISSMYERKKSDMFNMGFADVNASYLLENATDYLDNAILNTTLSPSLNSALSVDSAYDEFEETANAILSSASKRREALAQKVDAVVEKIKAIYDTFEREHNYAPGYFKYTPSYVKSLLKLDTTSYSIDALNRTYEKLNDILSSLESSISLLKRDALTSYKHVYDLYTGLDNKTKSKIAPKVEDIANQIKSGFYAKAMDNAKSLLSYIKSISNNAGDKSNDNNSISYLSYVAIVILGILIGYLYYAYYSASDKDKRKWKRIKKGGGY